MPFQTKVAGAFLALLVLAPTTSNAQYRGQKVSLDFRNQTPQELVVEYEVGIAGFGQQKQRVPLFPGQQLHDHFVSPNSTLTVRQGQRTANFRMDRHFNLVNFTGFDIQIDPWRNGDFQVHINNLTDHSINFTHSNRRPLRLDADISTVLTLRQPTTVRLVLENGAEYLVNATQDTDVTALPRGIFVDGRQIRADRPGRKPDRYQSYQVSIDNRSVEQVSYRYETSWGRFTNARDVPRNRLVDLDVQDHNELEVRIGGEPHLFVISHDTTIRIIRGFIFVGNRRYKAHHDGQNKLGVEYELDHDGGVTITRVQRGSVAEQLALQPGMVVLTINGEHIHSTDDFEDAVERATSDRNGRITVEVLQGDRIFEKNGRII